MKRNDYDAVVVGAGFAGLYAVYRLRQQGLSVRAYERGGGVGGVWYWNKYPGCRCDIESILYSYGFSEELQQEWTWSHRYAGQEEIRRYLNFVADRFDLRRDIQLETSVTGAAFDEDAQVWDVELNGEETVRAQFLVMASGILADGIVPDIPGRDDFAGETVHTGTWPESGVELEGKRVGIIGTGSSSIQSTPLIAKQASHLYVFQRTPQFAIPAWNREYAAEEIDQIKEGYAELRRHAWTTFGGVPYEEAPHDPHTASPAERDEWMQKAWERGGYLMIVTYPDVLLDMETNSVVSDFVRERIRERIEDPELAERLMPQYPFAAKRLCVDTEYFEAYNRDNVTLVDLREEPIQRVVPSGIELAGGSVIELDTLIFATGFDAVTGAVTRINPLGRGGITMRERWSDNADAYLGLMVNGFPNMFVISGPGSPALIYNLVPAIEHHVDWIADTIDFMSSNGQRVIESEAAADRAWGAEVAELAEQTVYPKVDSWYMGSNVEGKARVFLAWTIGGPAYFDRVEEIVQDSYRGFRLEPGLETAAVSRPAPLRESTREPRRPNAHRSGAT